MLKRKMSMVIGLLVVGLSLTSLLRNATADNDDNSLRKHHQELKFHRAANEAGTFRMPEVNGPVRVEISALGVDDTTNEPWAGMLTETLLFDTRTNILYSYLAQSLYSLGDGVGPTSSTTNSSTLSMTRYGQETRDVTVITLGPPSRRIDYTVHLWY